MNYKIDLCFWFLMSDLTMNSVYLHKLCFYMWLNNLVKLFLRNWYAITILKLMIPALKYVCHYISLVFMICIKGSSSCNKMNYYNHVPINCKIAPLWWKLKKKIIVMQDTFYTFLLIQVLSCCQRSMRMEKGMKPLDKSVEWI